MENKIPDNWVECRFGDVAKIHNGYAFATKDFRRDKGVPLIKQSQLNGDKVDLTKCVYLDESFLETKKDFVLKKGDVLIGMSGSVGKMCLYDLDFPALQNQRTGKAVPYSETLLNKKLFWYFLSTIERVLLEKGKGLGVTNVSADDIEDLVFNLPPLAEQHRIVAKLDAVMQKVESNKQRLEKIPKLLKRFRQSVLAAAVSGKLTEEWRKKNGIVGDWDVLILEDLISEGPQNGMYKPQSSYGSGIMILRIDNFYDGEINPWQLLKKLKVADNEYKLYSLQNDDIVVNRVNSMPYLGKSALVKNLTEKCVFESNMMRMKLKKDLVSPLYLIKYLNSMPGLQELRKNAKHAVNQSSINQQDVKAVEVPLPKPEEQKEIVRRVEQLFAFADKLESRYSKAKAMLD